MQMSIRGDGENKVEFWLEKDSDGDISLYAKSSKDAKIGKILWINPAGELNRYEDADETTGIKYVDNCIKRNYF